MVSVVKDLLVLKCKSFFENELKNREKLKLSIQKMTPTITIRTIPLKLIQHTCNAVAYH